MNETHDNVFPQAIHVSRADFAHAQHLARFGESALAFAELCLELLNLLASHLVHLAQLDVEFGVRLRLSQLQLQLLLLLLQLPDRRLLLSNVHLTNKNKQ